MTASSVAKKLGLKPHMSALIVGAPPGYLELLAPLPEGVTVSRAARGEHPFVQFFAMGIRDLQQSVPKLLQHADANVLVWIAYPKKTSGTESDLNRDVVRDAMSEIGWRSVSIVAIDDVWSALRFRPAE